MTHETFDAARTFALDNLAKIQEVAAINPLIPSPTWVRAVLQEGHSIRLELKMDNERPNGFSGKCIVEAF